ncbi:MAG: hypothetical protein HUN04_20565 [Desulfobacter sp.]|nr:MAG: hypothetical protein HUN04_20565 [Desulfobacter sp.]
MSKNPYGKYTKEFREEISYSGSQNNVRSMFLLTRTILDKKRLPVHY